MVRSELPGHPRVRERGISHPKRRGGARPRRRCCRSDGRRYVHSRPVWALCLALAIAGNVGSLVSMTDRVWFVGTLAATPLVLLMLAWIEDHRKQTGTGPSYYGGSDWSGSMGPPMA